MASTKKRRLGAMERLVRFLETDEHPEAVGLELGPEDPRLAPLLALAREADPRVFAFMDCLARRRQSFCLFDVEAYPEQLLRGKRGEPWNAGGAVVGPREVCLARNGGGDIYVWSADTGAVRFLLHDEGWKKRAQYASVDSFVEGVLSQCLELLEIERLDDADDAYLARVRVALEIGDADSLDEEARERLVELGLLED